MTPGRLTLDDLRELVSKISKTELPDKIFLNSGDFREIMRASGVKMSNPQPRDPTEIKICPDRSIPQGGYRFEGILK